MSFSDYFCSETWRESEMHRRFKDLLLPKTPQELENLAQQARQLTWQNFGKTMRLFAPLYLSNECVNACEYCGFSRDNESIVRVTLSPEQVETEARYLVNEGFRSLLLVAGEHPKFVSQSYLRECLDRLHTFVPSLSLEIGPMETADYLPLVKAGAEGLVVYQETYDREIYAELHTAGPKKDFDWRLNCAERAYEAGFKRLGIGALFGLADWRVEALALAAHVDYLLKHCWKSFLTVSLPRLRPAAGEFAPLTRLDDRDLTQLICALRLAFPQVGLVLSTREPQRLRDGLIPLGITHMSAGSHTEPGGYTGAGKEKVHHTVRGKAMPVIASEGEHKPATEQFAIADARSPKEVAQRLQEMGYDPVWKDWDQRLN
ncbi:MAG: 2-iminoacetate synthase ThiH [Verrucomicrobiae bacterium]|nr:2-iminoacetate synthase ThiH [Verrucomicrobiae bacterium]